MSSPLPCPWCGSTHDVNVWPAIGRLFAVRCSKCSARGPTKPTEAEGAAAWDRVAALAREASDDHR